MSKLNIHTPKGKTTLAQERYLQDEIRHVWGKQGIEIVETNKDEPADLDGLLIKGGTIVGVYEAKCRIMTYQELEQFGSWLVTMDKLERCQLIAKGLRAPLLGFLYLVPDNTILYWKLTDSAGAWLFDFETAKTVTQKNVNGGKATRLNAFLPLKYAHNLYG